MIRSLENLSTSKINSKNIISKFPIYSHIHFKLTNRSIPVDKFGLNFKNNNEGKLRNVPSNVIWSKDEVENRMNSLYHYEPQTITDYMMKYFVGFLYHSFNFITGYNANNPSLKSMQLRLIVLESFAGVPGYIAATFKHFRSLRKLETDHGWISTLLEEAENERMHLFIALEMFQTPASIRYLVIVSQYFMTPIMVMMYLINPKSLHRFVGYLEETACKTYRDTIKQIETPGTHLNKAWSNELAPEIAKEYYILPETALWVDALKCILADESFHRDINHTFANMKEDDINPFLILQNEILQSSIPDNTPKTSDESKK